MKPAILSSIIILFSFSESYGLKFSENNHNIETNTDSNVSTLCKCEIDVILKKAKLMCINPGLNYCYSDSISNDPIKDELDKLTTFWHNDKLNNKLYIRVVDSSINVDYLLVLNHEGTYNLHISNYYLKKVYGFENNDRIEQKYLLKHYYFPYFFKQLYPEMNGRSSSKKFYKSKSKQKSNYYKYSKQKYFFYIRVY